MILMFFWIAILWLGFMFFVTFPVFSIVCGLIAVFFCILGSFGD
jgi:hypothetical protein